MSRATKKYVMTEHTKNQKFQTTVLSLLLTGVKNTSDTSAKTGLMHFFVHSFYLRMQTKMV